MMTLGRDEKGRFTSPARELAEAAQGTAAKLQELALNQAELEKRAAALVAAENQPPEWLKKVVVDIATSLGITPEEFQARVKVVHPTPADPVLLVDGQAVVSWI